MPESRIQERTHSQTISERGCPVLSWCLTTGCFLESLEEYSNISGAADILVVRLRDLRTSHGTKLIDGVVCLSTKSTGSLTLLPTPFENVSSHFTLGESV